MIKLENQARYDGQWLIGTEIRQGKGTYILPDGSMYEGYWRDNKQNGAGRLIYYSGDVYEGQWVNDKAHGHGVYSFILPDDTKFVRYDG